MPQHVWRTCECRVRDPRSSSPNILPTTQWVTDDRSDPGRGLAPIPSPRHLDPLVERFTVCCVQVPAYRLEGRFLPDHGNGRWDDSPSSFPQVPLLVSTKENCIRLHVDLTNDRQATGMQAIVRDGILHSCYVGESNLRLLGRLAQLARFKFVHLNSPNGVARRAATANSSPTATQGCSAECVPIGFLRRRYRGLEGKAMRRGWR